MILQLDDQIDTQSYSKYNNREDIKEGDWLDTMGWSMKCGEGVLFFTWIDEERLLKAAGPFQNPSVLIQTEIMNESNKIILNEYPSEYTSTGVNLFQGSDCFGISDYIPESGTFEQIFKPEDSSRTQSVQIPLGLQLELTNSHKQVFKFVGEIDSNGYPAC